MLQNPLAVSVSTDERVCSRDPIAIHLPDL
jgi:hypothetical protein